MWVNSTLPTAPSSSRYLVNDGQVSLSAWAVTVTRRLAVAPLQIQGQRTLDRASSKRLGK
jgi:hypothetical protein